LEFGLFCSCLADSPPVDRRRPAWSQLALCFSCSSLVLERLHLIHFSSRLQSQDVWRTVRLGSADSPRGVCWSRTVRGVSTDGPLLRVWYWRFRGYFRTVRRSPRTVRLGLADGPPGACGRSAWCYAEMLSSLLLQFRFCFGIVWGLFLGLVGPL
jgi:hypothetical protein